MNELHDKSQWPQIAGLTITGPDSVHSDGAEAAQPHHDEDAAYMAAAQQAVAPDASPVTDIKAAMQANRAARMAAQARGGPVVNVAAVMNASLTEPPDVPGYGRPCRMTAAIRQIMMRWAKLPAEDRMEDLTCLMYCFLRPRDAWGQLNCFDLQKMEWLEQEAREDWFTSVMELSLVLTENPPEVQDRLAAWVNARIQDFFGSPPETPAATLTSQRPASPPCAPPLPGPPGAVPAGGFATLKTFPAGTPAGT